MSSMTSKVSDLVDFSEMKEALTAEEFEAVRAILSEL